MSIFIEHEIDNSTKGEITCGELKMWKDINSGDAKIV